MKFEWANRAADVLGCELEELTTAVFKHHLKQIIAQATARGGRLPPEEESPSGARVLCSFSLYLWNSCCHMGYFYLPTKFCALHCSCLCCGDRQCALSSSGSEVHLSALLLIK